MLQSLSIQNVAGIKKLDVDFNSPGLIAITGETGAGKSVFLNALALAVGARGSARLVRHGEAGAKVVANFAPHKTSEVWGILKDADIDAEDEIILRRSLTADGRSKAFINDQSVSMRLLAQVGGALVDIYGQFAAQELLSPSTHRVLLDGYIADDFDLAPRYRAMIDANNNLKMLQENAASARQREQTLRDDLSNLDGLSPEIGEEDALSQRRTRLMNSQRALDALALAMAAMDSDENPFAAAASALERGADALGESGVLAIDALARAQAEGDEARSLIRAMADDASGGESALEEVDERLHLLRTTARRHGCSVDDLVELLQSLRSQLDALSDGGKSLDGARATASKSRDEYIKAANLLRAARKSAAAKLTKAIEAELAPLHLSHARFVIEINDLDEDKWGDAGMDSVRFLVAIGSGDPAPIDKIASGGEAARFMLAIRAVMAACGAPKMIVFDEVDASIGGAVAAAVGSRLVNLASRHQLLVITHAPQVASKAKDHFIVRKLADGSSSLEACASRESEIARMLSGEKITTEAIAAAGKLLEQ